MENNEFTGTAPRLSDALLNELTVAVLRDKHLATAYSDGVCDRLRDLVEPSIEAFNDANDEYRADPELAARDYRKFRMHPVALSIRQAAGLRRSQSPRIRYIRVDEPLPPDSPQAKIAFTSLLLVAAGLTAQEQMFEPVFSRRAKLTIYKSLQKNVLSTASAEMTAERVHQLEKFADRFCINARPLTGPKTLEVMELQLVRALKGSWQIETSRPLI